MKISSIKRRTTMRLASILKTSLTAAGLLCCSTWALAQKVAVTIPASLEGTYDLTFNVDAAAKPDAPFVKGDKVLVVVMTGNRLCVNGKLYSSPTADAGFTQYPAWTDTATGVRFSFGNTTRAFNEINVVKGEQPNLTHYGYLAGSKTSADATVCAVGGVTPAPSAPTVSATVQSIFDLAEQVLPTQFKNGSALGVYQGYVYKYFASSGVYVGIKDDKLYTMGGVYGSAIKEQGTVAAVLSVLQAAKVKADAIAANTGGSTVVVPAGLYKLTLSGTYKMSGIAAISVPINLTINNLPAPGVSDTAMIVDQVTTSLGASGISNIKVTAINNTAARVTFRVEFNATLTGVGTVTYDLTYDYTR